MSSEIIKIVTCDICGEKETLPLTDADYFCFECSTYGILTISSEGKSKSDIQIVICPKCQKEIENHIIWTRLTAKEKEADPGD